jgi:hypothetical protein
MQIPGVVCEMLEALIFSLKRRTEAVFYSQAVSHGAKASLPRLYPDLNHVLTVDARQTWLA